MDQLNPGSQPVEVIELTSEIDPELLHPPFFTLPDGCLKGVSARHAASRLSRHYSGSACHCIARHLVEDNRIQPAGIKLIESIPNDPRRPNSPP